MSTSTEYLQWLKDMEALHKAKSAGYSGQDNPDPWANFRESEKFGIPAWKGALIRLSDKYSRIISLLQNPNNEQVGESLNDTLDDLAAYAGIVKVLMNEDS